MANISELQLGPSNFDGTVFDGRNMKLTANPKYAPNAWTTIEPPASVICKNIIY